MGRRLAAWSWCALAAAACGDKPAAVADPGAVAPPKALPRLGVVLGEPQDGLEALLLDEARRRGRELDVRPGYGSATATEAAVLALVDLKVEAIVFFPAAPDLLQRARRLAADREVPLLLALHGDALSGAWVGVPSSMLASEAGERVAARLAADGVTEPCVIVVEDARWPESRKRAEFAIRAVEQRLGKVEVRLRHPLGFSNEDTLERLLALMARMERIDAVIAGDPQSTAVAIAAVKRGGLAATACVAGISDDPALQTDARTTGARLALVSYSREQAVQTLFAGLDALLKAPADQVDAVQQAIPCELIGLEPEAPRKPGS